VDERNLNGLRDSVTTICEIATEAGKGSIDYAIFRPVADYVHLDGPLARLMPDTCVRAQERLGPGVSKIYLRAAASLRCM